MQDKCKQIHDASEVVLLSPKIDNQLIPSKAERPSPRKAKRFICLILILVVSILILGVEIGWIVHASASLWLPHSVQNALSEKSSVIAAFAAEQRDSEITWLQCESNQTSNCSVLGVDSSVSTLVKLMIGVKKQRAIRKSIKYRKRNRLRQLHCKYFTMSNLNNSLEWQGSFYEKYRRSNGHINITKSGIYGIFNLFTFSYLISNETTAPNIAHRININRPDGMNTSEVVFERNVVLRSDVETYDTSGFFEFLHLNKGDIIFPTLSDTSFIYNVKKANVWGVFRIG